MSRRRTLENAFWGVVERRKVGSNWIICCCIWSMKKNLWLRNILSKIWLIVLLWKVQKQHEVVCKTPEVCICLCTCESILLIRVGFVQVNLLKDLIVFSSPNNLMGEIGLSWSARSRSVEALWVNHCPGRHLADTLCWCLSPQSWKGGVDYWDLFWIHTWIFGLVVRK